MSSIACADLKENYKMYAFIFALEPAENCNHYQRIAGAILYTGFCRLLLQLQVQTVGYRAGGSIAVADENSSLSSYRLPESNERINSITIKVIVNLFFL